MKYNLTIKEFFKIRYIHLWIIWYFLKISSYIPHNLQMIFGRILGKIIRVLAKKNLSIVSRNISTCFPTISNRDKKKLINKHFESIGISFFEISTAWFASLKKVKKIVKVNGIENLNNALSKGNGVILFTAHFTCLEIAGAILEEICPNSNCMYNPQKNKMVDMMIKSGRTRFAKDQIPKNSIRSMLKALKNNEVVVYLADHVYKGSNSELIPFFGEPALTNTATTKIAKISKAKILPYFIRRSDDDDYIVDIYPELENFPSEDHIKDTSRLVNQLEQHIRISPDQYVWNYKRFRGRPKKFVDIYKN